MAGPVAPPRWSLGQALSPRVKNDLRAHLGATRPTTPKSGLAPRISGLWGVYGPIRLGDNLPLCVLAKGARRKH